VPHDVAALVALDLIHTLETDCRVVNRESGEFPGLVVLDGLHLLVHHLPLGDLIFCLTKRSRFLYRGEVELGVEHSARETERHGFPDHIVDGVKMKRRIIMVCIEIVLIDL
jgi:hypothetical protein